jgi:ketosteroid isomerase-like protein
MSRRSVELVRRSLEALSRGDFDAFFAAHDPATEWRTADDEPDQRTYRGIDMVREFVATLDDVWEDRFAGLMEFQDFVDRGEWVVVPWTARMRGRGSGISVEVRETYAVRVRGDRIVRVEEYRHVDQALASLEGRSGA